MKAVLLSPVVVLVVWSIAATLFSRSVVANSVPKGAVLQKAPNAAARHKTRRRNKKRTESLQEGVQEGLLNVLEVAETAYGQQAPASGGLPIIQPLGATGKEVPVIQPLGATGGSTPQIIVQPPLGTGDMMRQAQYPQQQTVTQQQQAVAQQQQAVVQQLPIVQQAQSVAPLQQPVVQQAQPLAQQQQPVAQQQQPQQRIYYYDPLKITRDASGNWILPETVYDVAGNPIPLAQLQHPSPPQQLQAPPRGASLDLSQLKNTSTSTDQSIIVATVGVMALLVGAISAKRSRSVMTNCLEDPTVQDEAAYDTACTNTYNTFTWKGDLEKFDV